MYRKKIAIYVEGQTEQIFINHLILTRWRYSGVKILNIKLQAYQDSVCKVRNFTPDADDELLTLFLITDVDGVGALASAIAQRANKQHDLCFEIIGLRDLSAQDFDSLPHNIDRAIHIAKTFQNALQKIGCKGAEKIELFFAIMTIEAWMLAFTKAVSKWARAAEKSILEKLPTINFEEIKAPSNVLKQIGSSTGKKDPKSFDEVVSFVSKITDSEIESVYESKKVSSFNRFWDRLTT